MIISKETTNKIPEESFGYWSPSGMSLFWMFPKVSFIKIQGNTAATDDIFIIENKPSKEQCLLSEENYLDAVAQGFSKIYIPIYDMGATNASERLIGDLIDLVIRHAKSRPKVSGWCRIMAVEMEVIIGTASHPNFYLDTYLKCLDADERLSKYSPVRPPDTMPD